MTKLVGILGFNFDTNTGWGSVAHYLSDSLKNDYNVVKFDFNSDCNSFYNYGIFRLHNSYIFFKQNEKKLSKLDVLVCTAEVYLGILCFVKKKYPNIKIIFLGYGTYTYKPFMQFKFLNIFNKKLLSYVDEFYVTSKYSYNKIKEYYKGDLKLIHLGVDLRKYNILDDVKKEKAFIFVGAQKNRKGLNILLKSFKLLLNDFPLTKLYLVGTKSIKFLDLVKELNLDKNVIFTGRIDHDELIKLYNSSLCQVLPSLNLKYEYEGFGLVHLEANACGIPSIGTLNSANEDIIELGVSGFLVKQNNVDDTYEKMKLILDMSEKEYENISKSSYVHALKFTWDKTAKELLKND